mgnify:CR=1 FL=1
MKLLRLIAMFVSGIPLCRACRLYDVNCVGMCGLTDEQRSVVKPDEQHAPREDEQHA